MEVVSSYTVPGSGNVGLVCELDKGAAWDSGL